MSVAVDYENWKTLGEQIQPIQLSLNALQNSVWNKSTDYVQVCCLGLGVFVLYSELECQNCKIDNELSVCPLVKLNGHVNSV